MIDLTREAGRAVVGFMVDRLRDHVRGQQPVAVEAPGQRTAASTGVNLLASPR